MSLRTGQDLAALREQDSVGSSEARRGAKLGEKRAVEREPDDDAAEQRAVLREDGRRALDMEAHRSLSRDQLAVDVEGRIGNRAGQADERGAVACLEGLLDARGVGERIRRSGQVRADSARVVVDRNAKRRVQTRVGVTDLAPGGHFAERP